MKKILCAILATAMLTALTGCGGSGNFSNTSDASDTSNGTSSYVTEDVNNSPDDTDSTLSEPAESSVEVKKTLEDEALYNAMVENSLMTLGDMTRMANVLKKAENGEEITVAYIGGSITEGLTVAPSKPELCWAHLSYKWLCEQYPDTKINFVNAGLSGTPSILGNVRLERDVLAFDPDICFVEFAVNDGTEMKYKVAYDSLVRTLLTAEKDIAPVLLFTVIESGHSCQPHMSEIGNNYGLPMISEPDSLGVEFKEGRMTWADYSDDQSHPHKRGHEIVCDFVTNYFEKVMAQIDENTGEVDKTLPDPKFSDRYMNVHFIDSETLSPELVGFEEADAHSWFHNDWSYRGKEGASMKFTITCKSLQMVYKENKSGMYAPADIYIDGEKTMTVSSNDKNGWDNPATAMLIDEDETAEHTVEITVPAEKALVFYVLGFGYCD